MQRDEQYPDDDRAGPGASPGLLIRPSTVDDAEQMAALANLPGFRFGTLRLPHESVETWRSRLRGNGPDDIGLVAVQDGTVVGMAGLHRMAGRRAHVGQIGMGVHDDRHGRGIGTALLAALVDAADNWLGLRRLELTVYPDNEPAIRLYRRFGFEAEGTHRDFAFRNGRYVDALAMARIR